MLTKTILCLLGIQVSAMAASAMAINEINLDLESGKGSQASRVDASAQPPAPNTAETAVAIPAPPPSAPSAPAVTVALASGYASAAALQARQLARTPTGCYFDCNLATLRLLHGISAAGYSLAAWCAHEAASEIHGKPYSYGVADRSLQATTVLCAMAAAGHGISIGFSSSVSCMDCCFCPMIISFVCTFGAAISSIISVGIVDNTALPMTDYLIAATVLTWTAWIPGLIGSCMMGQRASRSA